MFKTKVLQLTNVNIYLANSGNVSEPEHLLRENFIFSGPVTNGQLTRFFWDKNYLNLSKMFNKMPKTELPFPTGFIFEDFNEALYCTLRLSETKIYTY